MGVDNVDASALGALRELFGDALAGDPAHFTRMDNLEEAWRIVGPILDPGTEPLPYAPGTWGPAGGPG